MKEQYITGINSINNALDKKIPILNLLIDKNKVSKRLYKLEKTAKKQNITIRKVDKLAIDLVAIGSKHQGVAAELGNITNNNLTINDIINRDNPIILILDGIQDPHNLGACLRSAAAANVDAVIIPKNRAASITPTVRKVASGGAEIIPIFIETNLNRFLEKASKKNLWSIALTGHSDNNIYDIDLNEISIIIMGNEEKGISKNLLNQADYQAKIPMQSEIESLNVSVATGIVLFEKLRQRK